MASVTTSGASFQTILEAALDSYAKQTGVDLTTHASAHKLQNLRSPEDVIQLLQERETAFKDYRDKHQQLIDCLRPVVQVVHAFSGALGEAAGLVPAKAIFVGIDVLLSAAIGVSASYDALLDLFECVSSFLRRLHFYTEKIPLSSSMSDIMVKIMAEVLSVLALATKQMNQGRLKKFAKKLLGESDVEAILQRLDRLTHEEARMTVTHTLEVVHGLFRNLKLVMDDGKASMDSIRRALVMMQETTDRLHKIQRNQLQKDVRSWLSPPDPSTNHNIARRDHLDGTSSWFTQSDTFTEWKATGSLLWIRGKPGAGKSILCIIHEIERLRDAGLALMTYFYCDFRDAKKQEVTELLGSLLSQLSAKSDACYNILSALFSEYDAGSRRPGDPALMDCLEKMLKIEEQSKLYIVIDALDECPNGSGVVPPRERMLELVEKLVDLHLPNVHICVTSRPEADIQASLATLASHSVSLHDEDGQKRDISNFVRSVVSSDRNMRKWREEDKEMVIVTLTGKADGMFRWTVCQLEALRRSFPSAIRRSLDDLPRSLDETYERILLGIAPERQEFARRLFQCLAVSIRPLRVEELAEILAIQFSAGTLPNYDMNWRPENSEEAVLSACSSLITIVDVDGSRVVQFSHFSVKEYLISERLANTGNSLSQYYILLHSAHTILAQASLGVLLALDDQVDKNKIKNFPLAIYAAQYWVNHSQFGDVSSLTEDAMELLFDPARPHFAIWVWIYDIYHSFREILPTTHPTSPGAVPIFYATLCGFRGLIEHLVLTCRQDINARGVYHPPALHAAVVKGDANITTLLLEHGADVSILDHDKLTPLHQASRKAYLDIVELLLDHHADVDIHDGKGNTPLSWASIEGELNVTRALLRRGAFVDSRNLGGWTPLAVASRFGHLDVACLLLKSGATVDSCDNNGWTPLKIASRYGHLDVARMLLQGGAAVDCRNNDGWTPLMSASQDGHLDVICLLLRSGAAMESRNNAGWTPLNIASRQGRLDVVHLLLRSGADVDSRSNSGWTPLMSASQGGFVDVVHLLLKSGATLDNDSPTPSSNGQSLGSPLHLASANDHLLVAEVLIQYGANVNLPNQNQETPLQLVAGHGQFEVARLLLTSGSNVNSQDGEDSTPLHRASQSGHLDIATLLLESGADVNIRNRNDKTPLDVALDHGKFDVARFLMEYMGDVGSQSHIDLTLLDNAPQDSPLNVVQQSPEGTYISDDKRPSLHDDVEEGNLEIVRSLLDRGADVNERDAHQQTPLLCASRRGRVQVAKLLIDYGADVNFPERTGWAPLHMASWFGFLDVVLLLLENGADVNAKRQDNTTSLHIASHLGYIRGYIMIVDALLRWGANVHVRNDEGYTPSQLASRRGNREVVQLLSAHVHGA